MKLQYMCLDSALDLWPPGHFALEFFAPQIGRSEMECSALGFSYVRSKPRNRSINRGSRHTVFWSFPSFADLRLTFDVSDLIGRSKQT